MTLMFELEHDQVIEVINGLKPTVWEGQARSWCALYSGPFQRRIIQLSDPVGFICYQLTEEHEISGEAFYDLNLMGYRWLEVWDIFRECPMPRTQNGELQDLVITEVLADPGTYHVEPIQKRYGPAMLERVVDFGRSRNMRTFFFDEATSNYHRWDLH